MTNINYFVQGMAAWEKQRYKRAFELFQAGGARNDPNCLGMLGVCHETGKGCDKSFDLAMRSYRASFRVRPSSWVAENIATAYIAADNKRAARYWFQKGIDLKSGGAALGLACLLLKSPKAQIKKVKSLLELATLMSLSQEEFDEVQVLQRMLSSC